MSHVLASAPAIKSKSRQRFDATAFMVVAGELEAQGEDNFRLMYSEPKGECLVESFAVSGVTISAAYTPWEKSAQTLHYRFVASSAEEDREILVLYNGTVGLVAKGGHCFHVAETRDGVVSFYAMFGDQPAYPAVKQVVTEILSGTAKPLLAVRWPKGAKEGEVVAFDSDRLK